MTAARRYGHLMVLTVGLVGVIWYLSWASGDGPAPTDGAYLVWGGLVALALAGIVIGVLLHRPPGRLGWLLLVPALGLNGLGDLAARPSAMGLGTVTSPLAESLYLVAYVMLAAAALIIVRRRSPAGDRSALLDTLIVTVAASLAAWVFLVEPLLTTQHGALVAAGLVTYPVKDLILVAASARLWLCAETQRNVALRALAVALVALVVSDAAFIYQVGQGTWRYGTAWDAGWLVVLVAAAAAAMHESVAAPPPPLATQQQVSTWRFIVLLFLVVIVPPVLVIGQLADPSPAQAVVVVVGCGALFGLSLLRLRDLGVQLQETLRREGLLREANAALAAAPDRARVRQTAVSAVAEMVPGCRTWWVETGQGAHGQSHVAAADPPTSPQQVGHVRLEHLEHSARSGAVLRSPGPLFVGLEIPPALGVLAFPLTEQDRTIGYLVVATPGDAGPDLRAGLAALATATSLAHARVALSRALAERHSERRLRRMTQHATDIIAVLDLDLDVRYLTAAVERLIGTPAHLLIGRSWLELVLPADRETAEQLITQAFNDRPTKGEVRLVSGNGMHRYVELFATRVVEDDEPGFVLTCHDVTERRALEQQLTHQAFHDSLTGLANRALFRDRLEHAQSRSHRTASQFAVLFVDLDDFKNVNDTLGHAAGDELLRQVTYRLLDAVREQDTVARLGGDEFAVVLEDLADEEEAIQVAERFLQSMRIPFDVAGTQVSSGVSIGIATSTADSASADDAMRNADLALYEAKNLGKGRYALFIPVMHALAVDRMQLTSDLRRAIDQRELVVHFQPIVDLETDRTAGVEALVRWRHPERGLMGPGQFIPLAEETGLVVPLGREVLRQALSSAADWQQRLPGLDGLCVSVNLSARHLQQDTVVDDVSLALTESGVRPEAVILEITETVLLPDEGVTLERLQALNRLGIRLFIDDFGTGYSSLSYLQQLPVHGIKLAREFVASLRDPDRCDDCDDSSTGLVATIRVLAETLGLQSVIAEGVETAQQRAALLRLGYRLGQGFLMAPPMPGDAMLSQLTVEAADLSGVVGLGVR